MHEFARYAAPSVADEIDLVRRNPFALLVTPSSGAPVATHLPVVFPSGSVPSSWDDVVLLGHLARANPQWEVFASRPPVLLVFSGPDGYVSPSTYGYTPAVPTWNYAAVHVTGELEPVPDTASTLDVVEQTVQRAEGLRASPWDMSSSRGRFESLIEHVVAFRVRVREVRSVFKLSQDMSADVRARVRADVGGSLAEIMERYDGPPR
ncbi:FMN-binding negative transcriptional regulator [Amycolatopsis endophytica]|uniref:Transcriptional regulator n=1 Tax=Amycolatopsis endophytica TaxID=860233 RepID=A0A853AX40_9PSEU|nr:FMN-binding negative transcriptional regulator [Amycolatopsis endophytica]NYI87195.1 transcriptional regulator [Amycolatopsis endophytica]